MQTTLLLIRHGQTPWNALGKIQGCTDILLEEEGRNQARLLAEKLKGQFSAIYTSPLKRAYETAAILADSTALVPVAVSDLREINFGLWEGLTFKEVAAAYPETFSLFKSDEVQAPLCGGDGSLLNATLRARDCLLNLVKQYPGETIVAVSHGGFIKCALIGLFGLKMTMYHQMALGNTCVTTIRFTSDLMPVLIGLNDTSHLLHMEAKCI